MSKYTPLPPPQEAESVPLYLQNELQKISQATDTDEFEITGELLVNKISCRPEGHIYGTQQLVLNAGESASIAGTQEDEYVYINAEEGLQINSSPDNWGSGWAGRDTLRITGQGIVFGGAVNSGGTTSSSNTLDDYEEGTWTPTIFGSTSGSISPSNYNIHEARYTRVGRAVHFQTYISGINGTGDLNGYFQIGGLPFTCMNSFYSVPVTYASKFTSASSTGSGAGGYVQSNANYIRFTLGQSSTLQNQTTLNSSGSIMVCGTYETNA